MNRYLVKIRTPKGNETSVRTVEAVSKSSLSALVSVCQLLGIESPNFSVSVQCIVETSK